MVSCLSSTQPLVIERAFIEPPCMRKQIISLLTLALLSGCTRTVNPSDIKQNPNPKQRYEITMTILGAPGPFDSIEGYMGYDIENKKCIPEDPVSGKRSMPDATAAFAFIRLSDNIYKGVIYMDYFSDEDYYGLGVCRWQLTSSYEKLKINGVVMSPAIFLKDVTSNSSTTAYFSRKSYFDKKSTGRQDFGMPTNYLNQVKEHPDDYFSITLEAKAIAP